ncbi:MAG TPA: hypothetical protein VH590_00915 [Ktedonobacterales bacterium]
MSPGPASSISEAVASLTTGRLRWEACHSLQMADMTSAARLTVLAHRQTLDVLAVF